MKWKQQLQDVPSKWPRSALLASLALAGLAGVPKATNAQTSLADTISGCGGIAPLPTIQADPSDY